jgi:hypothetical protein
MSDFFSKVVDALQLEDWRVVLFLGVAIAAVGWNLVNRARWDAAWAAAGNAKMGIPERRWTYDAQDLERFARTAQPVGLLRPYLRILWTSDLCFAVFVATVSAYIWWRIAVTPVGYAFVNWAALPLGAMAILYGIADVAEDLKLASMLKYPHTIDQAEAAATNMLTRVKIVTISLSLIGLAIFGLYQAAEKCAVWLLSRFKRQQVRA